MKKYFGLQKVILALTTLTLVGLSSCNDQNFDWDKAHATEKYEKFTNVFIKEFGKPAEGHQWGFDMADMALGGDINFGSSTRAVLKQETNLPEQGNISIGEYLGKPADITDHEHVEVYNWFSNHKVYWSTTPTYSLDGNCTRGLKDGQVHEIDASFDYGSLNNSANYDVLHTYDYDENGLDLHFRNAWIQHVNSNKTTPTTQTYAYAENDIAYKFVGSNHQCDGVEHQTDYYYKKLGEKFVRCTVNGYAYYRRFAKKYYIYDSEWHAYECDQKGTLNVGEIWDNVTKGDLVGTTSEGKNIYSLTCFDSYYVKNGDVYYKVGDYNSGDYDSNTGYSFPDAEMKACICEQSNDNFKPYQNSDFTTANNMDYMCCWGYNLDGSAGGYWQNHLDDFNSGSGYGYRSGKQNAILVTNANVKNWTYGNSYGSSLPHDKYILVYLEGDDYKGWYLGFDFESWGDNLKNRIVADGICNDWIIKIGNFGDSTPYNPARIMCEDLGGDRTTNNYPQASDIDYNDIVLDVKLEDNQSVTLTLQAAGGTLPLLVTYGDIPLFETHEFFQESYTWDEGKNNRGNINYSVMYNTGADNGGVNKPVVEFKLFFKGQTPSGTKYKQVNNVDKFVFGDLHLKVYRQGIDDYMKSNTTNLSVAEWVDLGNVSGQAPLKLCVPSTTKWLKERQEINLGYPKFMDWVGNPLQKFWEKEIDSDYLY